MLTEIGKILRKLRIDYNEKQNEMAAKIGCTSSYLGMIEKGRRGLTREWMEFIVQNYQLSDADKVILQQSVDSYEDSKNLLNESVAKLRDAVQAQDKTAINIIKNISTFERAVYWIVNGETGASSLTIWAVMMGAVDLKNKESQADFDVPCDPDDFSRCYELLKLIPEWRERLPEVAEVFAELLPAWKLLVEKWDTLIALYEEEFDSGEAPKLFDLMQECTK